MDCSECVSEKYTLFPSEMYIPSEKAFGYNSTTLRGDYSLALENLSTEIQNTIQNDKSKKIDRDLSTLNTQRSIKVISQSF
jgi:hypothetical protein